MSRRMSHQAEIERRHMNRGSWSPDDQYCDYEYPDTGFSYDSYIYVSNKTSKVIIPGVKSKAVKILTDHWGLSFTEALQITVSIFKQIDVLDKYLQKTISCYMIMRKLNPKNLTTNITRLKVVLMSDTPDIFLSEIMNRYKRLT